jgi:hypothetical protein
MSRYIWLKTETVNMPFEAPRDLACYLIGFQITRLNRLDDPQKFSTDIPSEITLLWAGQKKESDPSPNLTDGEVDRINSFLKEYDEEDRHPEELYLAETINDMDDVDRDNYYDSMIDPDEDDWT